MKSRLLQVFGPIALWLFAGPALAQLDSTSAVLLRPSGKATSPQSLDSSRYKIRAPESRKDEDLEETPGTYIASPVPRNSKESAKVSTSTPAKTEPTAPATPATVPAGPAPATPVSPASATTPEIDRPDDRPPVTVQVKELILGGSEEDIEDAKKRIHPEDPRANILGISVAPAYFYQGSTSNYSFRNYHMDGPGFGLGMNVWFTPFFGIESKYFSSVSANVRDGSNGGNGVVPVDNQAFEAGIRFRRHFGYSRKSAQISWGIDYRDTTTKISPDAGDSIGGKTSGLGLSLEGSIPSSTYYAHQFEISARPFQHHSEMNTAANAKSGTRNETNAVSLSLGGQWTLDRQNQIFWKGEYNVERNLFNGDASAADPKTGAAPNGVSVTNSLAIFYFGFKWGS